MGAIRLPTIRELILQAGVMRRDKVCGCCLDQPLFEIDTSPTSEVRGVVFLVCMRCDFARV